MKDMAKLYIFFVCSALLESTVSITQTKSNLHEIVESSRDDLLRLFGADTIDTVPDYEVVQVHHDRQRRDLSGTRHYKISAFDKDFHLQLKPKDDVISPSLQVMTKTSRDHWQKQLHVPDGVFYQGHVTSNPDSHVAVRGSTIDEKLSGAIVMDNHMYQLHPIPEHVTRKMGVASRDHHVITRRSLKNTIKDFHIKPDKALQREDVDIQENTKSRMRRGAADKPQYYIEAMLTLDKPSCDHYGNMSMDYVLSVANLVNRLYSDPSLDMNVSWTLTKVILITKYEEALDIKNHNIGSAVGYMGRFARWARLNNSAEGEIGHYDNGALLSRTICGVNYCDLDGVAYSGIPCSSTLGYTINRATGLDAAFSVAHEMGHNFGLNHDTGDCQGYIMNAGQASGPKAFRWSKCSSQSLQAIFNQVKCYKNKPPTNVTLPVIPAGNNYNADQQCKMMHGDEYRECPVTKNSCIQLFCYRRGGCSSSGAPPVDGTPCGHRKWCIRGECVDIGNAIPAAIDGKWGSWGPYSSCSRTCGGGVKYRTRKCNNPRPKNHGKPCPGSSIGEWQICNNTDCPSGSPHYRKTQCKAIKSSYDDFYGGDGCRLWCRDGRSVASEGSVADGTRYSIDEYQIKDICINGKRETVGCDDVIHSSNIYDRCMRCRGNGNTCVPVNGSYTKKWNKYGPGNADPMVTIPAGSTNFFIKENYATWNLLNMKLASSSSLIFPGRPTNSKRTAAGVIIRYTMGRDINYAESMEFVGPSNAALVSMFVYVGFQPNAGYKYKFCKPGVSPATSFVWKTVRQGSCSRTCAKGVISQKVTCHRQDDQTEVSPIHCNSTRPDDVVYCNVQPCPGRWEVQLWGPCSTKCAGGKQTRDVPCVQQFEPNNYTIVSDSNCNITEKPSHEEQCNVVDCPPEWVAGQWSTCTKVGSSYQSTREVRCRIMLANATITYHNSTTCTSVSDGIIPISDKECIPSTSTSPPISSKEPTTEIITIIPVRGRRQGTAAPTLHKPTVTVAIAVAAMIVAMGITFGILFILHRRGSLACFYDRFGQEPSVYFNVFKKSSTISKGSDSAA